MDLDRFRLFQKRYGVCQVIPEWQTFFEFITAYFSNRGISRPIVVELGTERNHQKQFFEEFLNARHIGIDQSDRHGKPDIVGDAFSPETVETLKTMLDGEPINLLMAELDSPYENAVQSYNIFGQMTKNIVSFHSVCTPNGGVQRFWQELCDTQDEYVKLTLFNQHPPGHEYYKVRMGKGVLIKEWR